MEKSIPKGFKNTFKQDLLAGFSVSLIALPLCLGIALASGVPPIAGLFTAIIGGIFASRVAGSFVTISGPAAGLIVITLGAVEGLGQGDPVAGYAYALAAIVVAGLIIVAMGLLKVGKLGDFFPSAAVHGMLAAIGVIIIVKQLFVALGVKSPKGELIEVIQEIPHAFAHLNPEIAVIAVISLVILVVHPMIKNKWINMIPAPMWVLIATIPLSHAFDLFHEHHYHFAGNDFIIGPKYLVTLPDNVLDGVVFPDFGKLMAGAFWLSVISIALVSAIESLLSAKAVDTLDPLKRKSNLDRDLIAMGGGSALSGLIGGLPMISEIVRSSANVNAGARSQWANLFHGVFLLIFLLLLKPLIEQIPLAALAAMLVYTGLKLASPKEFKHMFQIGKRQLLVFLVTLLVVLATDLLIGIAAGIVTKLMLHLISGAPLFSIIKVNAEDIVEDDTTRIMVHDVAIFSNYLSLKKHIQSHLDSKKIIVDLTDVRMIDHTVMQNLNQYERELAGKGIELRLENFDHLKPVSNHPLARRVPVLPGEEIEHSLSKRQMQMLLFSSKNKYEYSPQQWVRLDAWQRFPLLRGKKMISLESKITMPVEGGELVIADLVFESGAQVTARQFNVTVMCLNLNGLEIPNFDLEKEGYLDNLIGKLGWDDINFDDSPKFSEQFLLRGTDSEGIKRLFSKNLRDFMEKNQGFALEGVSGSILIISKLEFLSIQNIQESIVFGKGLRKALQR